MHSYISPLFHVLLVRIWELQRLTIWGCFTHTLSLVTQHTRANPERLPFLFIFQTMLDAVPVMDLVKAFRFDEHLLAFQQARDACLARLASLFTFELRSIAWK